MRVECPRCKSIQWVEKSDGKETEGDLVLVCKQCQSPITIHRAKKDDDTSIGATRVKKDFTGSLRVMGVPDAIQMCHLGLKTGKLTLSSPRGEIEVYFKDGNIIYA